MASFFNISSRFGRGQPKAPSSNTPTNSTSPTDANYPPSQQQQQQQLPQLQPPSLSRIQSQASFTSQSSPSEASSPVDNNRDRSSSMNGPRKIPFFFREENSGLIVKGNFMTLAARPEHVEKGEWLAHQVVEQYRLLDGMTKIVQEIDNKTKLPICNPHTCINMSAGGYTYTWLDKAKNPVKIPAAQYIHLVQQWILSKINDQALFPTDASVTAYGAPSTSQINSSGTNTPIGAGPTSLPLSLSTLSGREWTGKSSGFPEVFETDIRNLYRQMFRCYAHLYHGHWLDPFYHISAYKELNTCFIHFVNVGKLFDLLEDKDVVPMQPLIDIWLAKGLLPTREQTIEANMSNREREQVQLQQQQQQQYGGQMYAQGVQR